MLPNTEFHCLLDKYSVFPSCCRESVFFSRSLLIKAFKFCRPSQLVGFKPARRLFEKQQLSLVQFHKGYIVSTRHAFCSTAVSALYARVEEHRKPYNENSSSCMIVDYHTKSPWKLARRINEENNTNPTINTTLTSSSNLQIGVPHRYYDQ